MSTTPTNTTVLATLARRGRFIVLLLLVFAGPIALFYLLRVVPTLDPFIKATTFHFWMVSVSALLGLVAAVVLRASVSREDIWIFFAGMGFLSIAGVFLLHSLATENIILGEPHRGFSMSPPTSLAAGAVFLGLSAVPYHRRIELSRCHPRQQHPYGCLHNRRGGCIRRTDDGMGVPGGMVFRNDTLARFLSPSRGITSTPRWWTRSCKPM